MLFRSAFIFSLVCLTACNSTRAPAEASVELDESTNYRIDDTSPAGPSPVVPRREDIEPVSAERAAELDSTMADIVARHQINTGAVAVVKNGEVVWSNHYGEQSEGVAASGQTLFDVASITKTVTAETVLRLVADGDLSLDEPMSAYWLDPDLKGDTRHRLLTPRMALSHTTGFMNWRYFAEDRRLAFVDEPGTRFGYSGEGFAYLARFVEAKLSEPFERLAQRAVFEPSGINTAAMSVDPANFPHIAQPLDSDGDFPGYYCSPDGWCRDPGDFSSAGGMVISLGDLTRFMTRAMNGDGLTPELMAERNTLHSEQDGIDCSGAPEALCPTRVGWGLGWNIHEFEGGRTIGHRGSDWSVVSLAYYYESSHDGLVVLFNAPNRFGIAAMVDALRLLDPDSPELHGYIARRSRAGG